MPSLRDLTRHLGFQLRGKRHPAMRSDPLPLWTVGTVFHCRRNGSQDVRHESSVAEKLLITRFQRLADSLNLSRPDPVRWDEHSGESHALANIGGAFVYPRL